MAPSYPYMTSSCVLYARLRHGLKLLPGRPVLVGKDPVLVEVSIFKGRSLQLEVLGSQDFLYARIVWRRHELQMLALNIPHLSLSVEVVVLFTF